MSRPIAADLAAREGLLRHALAAAEGALAAGEPHDAEKRAKALSAITKAATELDQWRGNAMAALEADEEEHDGEAYRRELELRINRFRREQGLDPLFDEDPGPA